MIRALLVDDEELARDRLRRLLAESPDVQIVGEAADGTEAMERIAELTPAVVFLDIQMPGCTGLEVAAALSDPRPHIVFCTAYDRYAIDAFELHAVDYLLKPINRARLAQALDRVRAGAAPPAFDAAVQAAAPVRRFLGRKGNRFRVVAASDVLAFVSENGLTKLLAAGEHYWVSPTLNDLEARLDAAQFCRISRAAIVNLDAIEELTPSASGNGEVTLRDGTKLEVSRRRFKELTDRLSA
jgi:two-component system, LytTR family, response regulator